MGSRRPPGGLQEGSCGGSGGLWRGSCEPFGEFLAEMPREVNVRSLLEASWGRPGAVLGPSWGRLGAILGLLGAPLGLPWGLWWPSRGHLEASWGSLGASWGDLGRAVGVSMAKLVK